MMVGATDDQLGPLLARRGSAPAYWAFGTLWVVLADVRQTGGAFSVMEQWMRAGPGPGAHVHPIDEWFYVLDGEMELRVGNDEVQGAPGDSVWIPRGTPHSFDVSRDCHVLNGYTPGGFEQVIMGLGTPAERRELPPEGVTPEPALVDKLYDNYWSARVDSPWSDMIQQR